MNRKRRYHSTELKAVVAMEALRRAKTVNELAREYKVHLLGKRQGVRAGAKPRPRFTHPSFF